MRKHRKTLLVIAALTVLLISACSLLSSQQTPTPTTLPESNTSAGGSADAGADADADAQEPTAEPTTAPEDPSGDDDNGGSEDKAECLVGTWQVNNAEFKEYLATMMQESTGGEMSVSVSEVSGSMTLTLAEDGTMTVDSNNFTISMAMTTGETTITSQTTVVTEGTAQWEVNDEGQIVTSGQNLESEGSGTVSGEGFTASGSGTITLTPNMFFVSGGGLEMSGQAETSQASSVTCSGDTLTAEIEGYGPMTWSRVDG